MKSLITRRFAHIGLVSVALAFASATTLAAETEHLAGATTQVTTSEQQVELINVNTADINQLITLNGIGESKAKAIIAYRESNGAFNDYEQLLKVKGIGLKLIQRNERRIVFK